MAHGYRKKDNVLQLRSSGVTNVLLGTKVYKAKSSQLLFVSIREVGGSRSRAREEKHHRHWL